MRHFFLDVGCHLFRVAYINIFIKVNAEHAAHHFLHQFGRLLIRFGVRFVESLRIVFVVNGLQIVDTMTVDQFKRYVLNQVNKLLLFRFRMVILLVRAVKHTNHIGPKLMVLFH